MVQSIKSLREHRFQLPGKRPRDATKLDESAMSMSDQGGEGLYVDPTLSTKSFGRLTSLLDEARSAAEGVAKPAMRDELLKQLKKMKSSMEPGIKKGQLKVGKKRKQNFLDVAMENVVKEKRVKDPPVKSPIPLAQSKPNPVTAAASPSSSRPENNKAIGKKKAAKKNKGNARIGIGDMVSIPSTAFDGDVPGSYSERILEPCFGKVLEMENGVVNVEWLDGSKDKVKQRDLKLEARKKDLDSVVSNIIVMLVEGEQVAFESKEKTNWPKNFFEVLVRKDWRSWVQAVKKELTGWDSNNAVTVVDMKDVPKNAKVVPLGELYTVKRNGTHKFRQYLMGNLLREGIDFKETFSTTVSNTGICLFFSLATSCNKEVWGWDAICGYLQCEEQYDVFAFLPSHHAYSSLEYEDIALMRQEFLQLVEDEGEEG